MGGSYRRLEQSFTVRDHCEGIEWEHEQHRNIDIKLFEDLAFYFLSLGEDEFYRGETDVTPCGTRDYCDQVLFACDVAFYS